MKYLITPLILAVLVGCGRTVDVSTINLPPANGGSDADPCTLDRLPRALISPYLGWHVLRHTRAGFAVVAARDGQLQYAISAGHADIEQDIPFTVDTRVRIASMTKPITAVAALQLVEQGRLGLDDAVADYLPAFAHSRVAVHPQRNAAGEFDTQPLRRPLTVRDLLEFRAGMGDVPADIPPGTLISDLGQVWSQWFADNGLLNLEQRAELLARIPLQEQPGERWRYGHDLDVVARLVEVIAEQPFEDYLASHIFQPLGMEHTGFMPAPEARGDMAGAYGYGKDGELVIAPDRPWHTKGRVWGSRGLISTAPDYLRFALMLWNNGSYNGAQILKPETVALMTRLHVPSGVLRNYSMNGLGWGLGIGVVADGDQTPFPAATGDFYWSGYYGTHFWISPSSGLVFVYVTQHDYAIGNGVSRGQQIPYVVQALLMKSARACSSGSGQT